MKFAWSPSHSIGLQYAALVLFGCTLFLSPPSLAVPFSDLAFKRQGRDSIALVKSTNAPYTGVATSYHENGKKRAESYYLNGNRHGPSYRWFEDGRLEEQTHWLDGKQHGVEQTFDQDRYEKDSNGQALYYPKGRFDYQYGAETGEQVSWRYGHRYDEITMINGHENGMKIRWAQDKNEQNYLEKSEHYLDGKKIGLSRDYFYDGRLKQEAFFDNGSKNGLDIEYDLNDAGSAYLSYIQFRLDGDRLSTSLKHSKNGALVIRTYRNDKSFGFVHQLAKKGVLLMLSVTGTGKDILYNEDTNIRSSEENKIQGYSDKLQYYWFKSGSLQTVRQYEAGKLSEPMTEWYENGRKKFQISYGEQPDEYLESEWYDNGQLRQQGIKGDRGKLGTHKAWYKSGQLKSEIEYSLVKQGRSLYSVKHGKETQWYSNGQLKIEMTYYKDRAVGTRRTWLDDGTLYSEKEMDM
ncbi:toxin-antitoxin system YwqK family antitoxin [Vibrio scophthalmi]|uniref:toxin-antitoxin system YwqK family antitoxin n=1 Tax=Vibrio scophthalmi TaxID=45658 RepID=UPI003EBE18CE